MKKSILLQLGLGLIVVFGLTACVEKQVINPAFNPVDNTINTQFYFNISSITGETDLNTKQADTNVQAKGNFRGIDNASLFALIDSTISPTQSMAKKKMVKPFKATAMRDLSTLLGQSSIASGQKGGTRIVEINLPVGVNELVFYAKATKKEITGLDSRELYGSLNYTTTPENYLDLAELIGSFAERRLSDSDTTKFTIIKDLICSGINGLFRTTAVTSGTSAWYDTTLANPTITYNDGTTTESYTVSTLRWVDYASAGVDDNPVSPYFFESDGTTHRPAAEMEKILGKAYVLMAGGRYTISGGSGSSTVRLLADLYNVVASGAEATPLSLQEAVAQVICKKMKYSIECLTDPIPNSITGERKWKSVSDLRTLMGGADGSADLYNINDFPENFHLPAGATTTGAGNPIIIPHEGGAPTVIPQITYTSAIDTLMNGSSSTKNIYTYAPELCYYGNSTIRTNNSNELNNGSYPSSYTQWYNNDSWAGKNWEADGTAITNSTRGIAMTNSIQYGIALLSSRLVLSTATGLTDNGALLADQAKIINLDDAHYLRWTGILIGGQPEQVGWNYLLKQKDGVAAGSNAIVYDKVNYRLVENTTRDTCGVDVTKAGFVGSTADASDAFTNYTLLYDNVNPYAETDAAQGNVYVALEFVNLLGQDFWGEQGLIRQGETFYLLAELTPNPQVTNLEGIWNNIFDPDKGANHYLLPPYNLNTGVSRPIRRVFVQDVMTIVDFRFLPETLKHAYISIPDLRSAKISLGLAVDLNWYEGLKYETPLGL